MLHSIHARVEAVNWHHCKTTSAKTVSSERPALGQRTSENTPEKHLSGNEWKLTCLESSLLITY